MPGIALHIDRQLGIPVASVGFGPPCIEAALFRVHVPEATVHEDNLLARAEDEVGLARKVFGVQAIAIAEGVDEAADGAS